MSHLRILHLVGSPENEFYTSLSFVYAKGCLKSTANPALYKFYIAYVSPDKQWRFPTSLDKEDIAKAQSMSLAAAIEYINLLKIDLVIPQMFCRKGMITYRSLFDLLSIPYIGNTPEVMSLTYNKAQAKAVVEAAGIKVPPGELLQKGQTPTITPPAVVKPTNSDNSLGVTLVKDESEYEAALATAFNCSDQVIVEKFIELGREVRCGVIVKDGELIGLPLEEYAMDSDTKPIRKHEDKLKQGENGELILAAKDSKKSWIVYPEDETTKRIQEIAKRCHKALGCRHYSLFDFRIDASGQPWFLEAGLYCSFSPKSVIPAMAKAAGIPLDQLFLIMQDNALNRGKDLVLT